MNADNSEALLAKTIKSLKKNDFSFYLNRWLRTLANHDNTTILAYFRDETPQILLTDSETIAVHQNMSHVYLPLCAIGVTSLIDVILKPIAANALSALSLPDPGPCTSTSRVLTPCS